ncbi:MAG: beta-ketoacyl-ACP synthase II [Syntrophales bacterium]
MRKRVVITGLGAVSPLGNSAAQTWEGLCAGRPGIAVVKKFDASGYRTRIGGELKNFDPLLFVNAKERRRYDDFIIYALACAEMAVADSGLVIGRGNADRVGVIIGTGIGGLAMIENAKETLLNRGPQAISPFLVPGVIANLAAGQVSIRFGAKGPINCTVTACSSGGSAIGSAFRIISEGYAEAVIAGGTEAAITPLAFAGFGAMRALSTNNDRPEAASRPFDKGRDGFVLGEGCGILIMEEMTAALNRGARIYAEVAGLGETGDAFHIAAPPPGHEGAVRCMELALRDAGMKPADIDYINAHGTATPLNDIYETQAIKRVFGEYSRSLPVSSTKSMTGHLLGGAGGLEAVISVMAITYGTIPPTINLDDPDPECDLDYVPHIARTKEIRSVMSNSFGFGGVNVVLIFRQFEERVDR